jgi:hypothetical protein
MDALELAQWRAYFEVEPWGTHAAEILGAQLCQIVWATNSTKASPKMEELMPFVKVQKHYTKDPITGEALQDKVRMAFNALGAKVV